MPKCEEPHVQLGSGEPSESCRFVVGRMYESNYPRSCHSAMPDNHDSFPGVGLIYMDRLWRHQRGGPGPLAFACQGQFRFRLPWLRHAWLHSRVAVSAPRLLVFDEAEWTAVILFVGEVLTVPDLAQRHSGLHAPKNLNELRPTGAPPGNCPLEDPCGRLGRHVLCAGRSRQVPAGCR